MVRRAKRLTVIASALVLHQLGCASARPVPAQAVRSQPEPGPCPQEAIAAMAEFLGWSAGMEPYIRFVYDERQPGSMVDVAFMREGPVTGLLEEQVGKAPQGTRVDGHLWVKGNHLYGRYTRMHLADGRTVPVCLEIDVVSRQLFVEGGPVVNEEEPAVKGEFRFFSAWHVMPVLSYMQSP